MEYRYRITWNRPNGPKSWYAYTAKEAEKKARYIYRNRPQSTDIRIEKRNSFGDWQPFRRIERWTHPSTGRTYQHWIY